jgi:hypothetical protein
MRDFCPLVPGALVSVGYSDFARSDVAAKVDSTLPNVIFLLPEMNRLDARLFA